jgi:hypothetical protein
MSPNDPQKMVYTSARNLVTDGFYPLLLSNVHDLAPDLPLDPVIFRSLLLSILASGNTNLLLRTSEDDVSLVQNVTALVSTCPLRRTPRINPVGRSGIHLLIIINLDSI